MAEAQVLKDVLAELVGIFEGDARLTAAILATVGILATPIDLGGTASLVVGILLVGCLAVLVGAVARPARQQKAGQAFRPT